MTAIIAFLFSTVGKYIIGGIGIAGALLAAWFRAKALGRKEQAAKQAAADAKAVNTAGQVRTQVEAMKPDDVRSELAKRATDK
jgi:hypothetical protein